MKDILAAPQRPLLQSLAGQRTLLAFDFDGTLAPIVDSRSDARMPSATLSVLRALSERWPCAVLSGRRRRDVRSRLGPVRLFAVVGNHGAEESPALDGAAGWRRQVRAWRRELAAKRGALRGAEVEDKGLSLAVHVRDASAAPAVGSILAGLPGARVVGGKRVWNVLVPDAPDKGASLERIVDRGAFDHVAFVGDDETDEDVFRRRFAVPLLGVSVGRRSGSAAGFFLRDQEDVVRLLSLLEGMRSRPHATSRGAGGAGE